MIGLHPGLVREVAQTMHRVARALEDLPRHEHDAVRMLLSRPGADVSLRQQVEDLGLNSAGLAFGATEAAAEHLGLLQVLTGLTTQHPYTYRVDRALIRGARPTADKLRRLAAAGCRRTINLCAELPEGDGDLITEAGLTGLMDAVHVPVVDCTAPTLDDVGRFLAALDEAGAAQSPGATYVHCEAGMGRTGVMVACYRMSRGWAMADARQEAHNFGCAMPDQLAFIEAFAPVGAPAGLAADPVALQQDRAAHADPVGLDRALA